MVLFKCSPSSLFISSGHTCPCRLEPSHSQKIFRWADVCLCPHTCTSQSAALLQSASSMFSTSSYAALQGTASSASLRAQPGISNPGDTLTNPVATFGYPQPHPSRHSSPYQPTDCRRRTAARSVSDKATAPAPPAGWLRCTCPAQRQSTGWPQTSQHKSWLLKHDLDLLIRWYQGDI